MSKTRITTLIAGIIAAGVITGGAIYLNSGNVVFEGEEKFEVTMEEYVKIKNYLLGQYETEGYLTIQEYQLMIRLLDWEARQGFLTDISGQSLGEQLLKVKQ